MRSLAALLALAACTHQRLTVHPVEIAHAATELHARQQATLMMVTEPIDPTLHTLAMGDEVRVPLDADPSEPVKMSVSDLLADCPVRSFDLDPRTRAAYPKCQLFETGPRRILVADHRRLSGAFYTGLALAGVGGLFACGFECSSPYKYVADGVLLTGAVAVTGGLMLLMYSVAKMH